MSRRWDAVDGWKCSECGHVIIGAIDAHLDEWHAEGCVDESVIGRMSAHDPAELNTLAKIVTGAAGERHPLFSVRYRIAVAILESDWLREKLSGQPQARVIPSRTTDPATSHQAAATITVKAGTQRAHLLFAFNDYDRNPDGYGLTDEQAMNNCYHVLPTSEFSKRCSELREAGLIEPTGETRTGASGHQRIVSRITDAGRKAVASL